MTGDEQAVATDRDLMDRARAGERAALDRLLTTERLARIRRVLSVKLSADETDEVCGEVVARIYRGIHTFEGADPPQFDAWISAIARNVALELIRRNSRDRQRSASIEAGRLEPAIPDAASAFDDRTWLIWALNQLPADFAETFLLSVRDGFSHRDIGRMMTVSETTVATRIHRVRQALMALHERTERV